MQTNRRNEEQPTRTFWDRRWELGTVFGIIVILAGVGWFSVTQTTTPPCMGDVSLEFDAALVVGDDGWKLENQTDSHDKSYFDTALKDRQLCLNSGEYDAPDEDPYSWGHHGRNSYLYVQTIPDEGEVSRSYRLMLEQARIGLNFNGFIAWGDYSIPPLYFRDRYPAVASQVWEACDGDAPQNVSLMVERDQALPRQIPELLELLTSGRFDTVRFDCYTVEGGEEIVTIHTIPFVPEDTE